jgi:3-demethoxyubiquinol 3-hydroxylase
MLERLILAFDGALRAVAGVTRPARPTPGGGLPEADLPAAERRRVVALMRVNHAGEVCAQALYHGQALLARDPVIRRELDASAAEEGDHLHWTRERLQVLGGRTSRLDPLWYAGAFGIGVTAAAFGDRVSLGFLKETEAQVVAHLEAHLARLPADDVVSREVLRVMRDDEGAHAAKAVSLGAADFPLPVRVAMRATARVMTSVAYYV